MELMHEDDVSAQRAVVSSCVYSMEDRKEKCHLPPAAAQFAIRSLQQGSYLQLQLLCNGDVRKSCCTALHPLASSPITQIILCTLLLCATQVYRMGLLMRKLDAARLQPPPDGACSSSSSEPGVLSEVDVAQATNSMLFIGIAAPAGRLKAATAARVQGRC
jgi:hypothetical protein